MLSDDRILQLALAAVENLNQELDAGQKLEVSPDMPLFGANAVLDSLQLVSVIVDVETSLAEALGFPLSLTDDHAISQSDSLYRTPASLTAYISSRLQSAGK
jgi:acyl carrier protein